MTMQSPYEGELPCAVCGKFVDDCVCPECPTCGVIGESRCYDEDEIRQSFDPPLSGPHHGLKLNIDQKIARQEWEVEQRKLLWQESVQYLDYLKDQKEVQEDREYS